MKPVHSRVKQLAVLKAAFDAGQKHSLADAVVEQDFVIRLLARPAKVRIAVWGNERIVGKPLLFITTHSSAGGRPAGILAEDEGRFFLHHDGRTRHLDFGNPYSEIRDVVAGHEYYRIGEVGPNLFRDIVSFHCSRIAYRNWDSSSAEAYDPGLRDPVVVPEHIKNLSAKHHAICEALKQIALANQWQISGKKTCSPDLAIHRGSKKLLIEVKPDGGINEICSAIGQLLLYGLEFQDYDKVIVAPIVENTYKRVKELIQRVGIRWVDGAIDGITTGSAVALLR